MQKVLAMELSNIAIPTLPSRSIPETLAFYSRLGFVGDAHAFDPNYAILRRGTVELHFFKHDGLEPAKSSAGCYMRVTDAEEIFLAFAQSNLPKVGIPRMDRLEDKPWGLREFAVIDLDGNQLRIGQLIGK
jgi:catechol 2,3-dioxygenase-like lactoylglutathione lyase family enzyme